MRVLVVLLWAVNFFGAALATVSMAFLIVNRMVDQLKHSATSERRASAIFLEPRRIIHEHNRLYPQSGLMLAFWLSLIYLVVWVSGMVLSLAMDVGSL